MWWLDLSENAGHVISVWKASLISVSCFSNRCAVQFNLFYFYHLTQDDHWETPGTRQACWMWISPTVGNLHSYNSKGIVSHWVQITFRRINIWNIYQYKPYIHNRGKTKPFFVFENKSQNDIKSTYNLGTSIFLIRSSIVLTVSPRSIYSPFGYANSSRMVPSQESLLCHGNKLSKGHGGELAGPYKGKNRTVWCKSTIVFISIVKY